MDEAPKTRQKISLSESPTLVPLAKSKKLAALRQQAQAAQPVVLKHTHKDRHLAARSDDTETLLATARARIDARIDELMAAYPQGKQKKLFALRYGTPDSIKHKTIKAIFVQLQITGLKAFTKVEGLDYFGRALD